MTVNIPTDRRFINLTGKVFEKWTVLEYRGKYKSESMWLCKCECGVEKSITGKSLKQKKSKSCKTCARLKDLTGQEYGDWKIIKHLFREDRNNFWLCKCKLCGFEKSLSTGELNRSGRTNRCTNCRVGKVGYKISDPRYNKAQSYLKRYGIKYTDVEKMLCKQDGKCANPGCGNLIVIGIRAEKGGVCVDHDHTTKKVRGLLCYSCNLGIGMFVNDPMKLRGAATYLELTS